MGNTETMKRMGRAGRVNVKRKEAEIARANRPNAAAQTDRCAQKNKKLRQNVLDGADFVRDVIDIYPIGDEFRIVVSHVYAFAQKCAKRNSSPR